MEQVESIPFSSLIAGLLLCKKSYNSAEVVNVISELEGQGIMIEDENDDMERMSCCVEMSPNFDFHLKKGLEYVTVLSPGVTVFKFLMIHTDERILSFLDNRFKDDFLSQKGVQDLTESSLSQGISFRYDVKKGFFGKQRKVLVKRKSPVKDMNGREVPMVSWPAILG